MEGLPIGTRFDISLANGTSLEGAYMNGSNYVFDHEVDESSFRGLINPVTITAHVPGVEEDVVEEHENMFLGGIIEYGGEWYVGLLDTPQDVIDRERTQANIEYIAMMTDVDLGDLS